MSTASSQRLGSPSPEPSINLPSKLAGPQPGRPLLIGIDVRRAGGFGVGTYIQNLVLALARVGTAEEYVLVGTPTLAPNFSSLPPNFRFVPYARRFDSTRTHLSFQFLLRRLALDLFHMPHRWA